MASTMSVCLASTATSQCLNNPSFETGDLTDWTLTDLAAPFFPAQVSGAGASAWPLHFSSSPTDGNASFVHGFDGGMGKILLQQDLTVAAGASTLAFDYRAAWDLVLTGTATLDRSFDVLVLDPTSGATLQSTNILVAMANTLVADTGPQTGSVDLSGFVGQTVTVSFEWDIPETTTGPGMFELDNITCGMGGGFSTNYCGPAVVNSTGASAEISATGNAAVSANDVTLMASNLPTNQFGIFVTSQMQGLTPGAGGTSNGDLCVGGMIGRFTTPSQIQNSGATGTFSFQPDLTMFPQGSGFVAVAPGDTWNFQAWYRDAVGLGSNFTDAVAITFQ